MFIALWAFAGFVTALPASFTVTEIPLTTPCCPGGGITVGPGSDFWLVAGSGLVQARRNGSGFFHPLPFSVPAAPALIDIALGPDRNFWVTDYTGRRVIRVDPSDPVAAASFSLPGPGVTPGAIVAGPDGNLWFTEPPEKIGRIATSGAITEFAIPTPSSDPERICVGPDGNLWFTETGVHFSGGQFRYNIGRITTAGVVTEFEIPTADSFPQGIAPGRDGNLWFTERGIDRIGRITPGGLITEFPIPSPSPTAELSLLTSGPDGHIWFAQDNRDSLGRFDPATPNQIEQVPIPPRVEVAGFVNGQDGDLWFAEFYPHNALVRIDLAAAPSSQPIPALSTPMAAALVVALFLAAASRLRGH